MRASGVRGQSGRAGSGAGRVWRDGSGREGAGSGRVISGVGWVGKNSNTTADQLCLILAVCKEKLSQITRQALLKARIQIMRRVEHLQSKSRTLL